jgi:hypothetical protein
MSNFTDFISSGGGGGGPRLALPLARGNIKLGMAANIYARDVSQFWTYLGYISYDGGTLTQTNVSGTGWNTIHNQTSGGGYCTHIIFPQHTAGEYSCRITVDGVATTYVLPPTVQYYGFMFGSSDTSIHQYTSGAQYKPPWNSDMAVTDKNTAIRQGHYLAYETSLKVEVLQGSAGTWMTGTYQKKAGVVTYTMVGIEKE